jgi:type III secretory pathway component EscU
MVVAKTKRGKPSILSKRKRRKLKDETASGVLGL